MIRIIKAISICILFCTPFSSAFSSYQSSNFKIVVSFSLIKNWVEILTKGVSSDTRMITITNLVPISSDPHIYQPTPMDGKAIEQANLILTIGLSFEGWMDRLISASETKGFVFKITNDVDVRTVPAPDPHVWHDVQKVRQMIQNLTKILCKKLPEAAHIIQKNAADYDKILEELDNWIRINISQVPRANRKIITTHDAFYYYAKAYNLDFYAPIGLSTEGEADARTVALLIQQIRSDKIKAVFFENLANRNVVSQIADETGIKISDDDILYADSVSDENGPAADYVKMMRHNTEIIVKSLMA